MRRLLLLVMLACTAVACQVPNTDNGAVALTRAMFDDIRAGRDTDLLARLPPQRDPAAAQAVLVKLRGLLPAREPRGWKIVGSNMVENASRRDLALTLEYDYGDHTALVQSQLTGPRGVGGWQAEGIHVRVASAQELAVNNFNVSLVDTPIHKLGFLIAAAASPLLMIAALVRVIRRSGLRRKWLWGIAAFAGLFSFHLDWATGQIAINWLTIQFIGAGAVRGASQFDPWIVTTTLPLGAILILTGVWANPARAKKKTSPASGGSAPSPAR